MILIFLDSSAGAVRLLSIDFTKAFDKLSHSSIISACVELGVDCNLVKWLGSFLTNRKQRVLSNGLPSAWASACSGVPQGSVLGPVLFCLVIDSLTPACSKTKILKYADDVVFLHFLRTPSEDDLHLEWNSLLKWSSDVSLPINFEKCKVMDFVTKKNLVLSPVPVSPGKYVKSVTSISFLGVTLSHDFRWNTHFDNILAKVMKRIFMIRNLRRSNCPVNLLWKVYECLLRSIFMYASPSFCNAPAYLFNKLLAFERRVCRIVNIVPNSRPSVTSLIDSMCKKLFCQVARHKNHPLNALFEKKNESKTRCKELFRPPRCKTKRFSNSFIKYCA